MEIIIIAVVMIGAMMLLSRNAKKRQQQADKQRDASLEPGKWVMTSAGFYGRVVDVDGDVVILENLDGHETLWNRQAIRSFAEPPFGSAREAEENDSADSEAASSEGIEAGLNEAEAAANEGAAEKNADEDEADDAADLAVDDSAKSDETSAVETETKTIGDEADAADYDSNVESKDQGSEKNN